MIKNLILFSYLSLVIADCAQVNILLHNEDMAAKSAIEFAQIAFVNQDLKKAYVLMSENFQKYYAFEKFEHLISTLHTTGYPTQIKAIEFEPMPGQKGMYIFLEGRNDNKKFYYRFQMEGTANIGYKVTGMWRGNGPYPSSKLRQKLKDK